MTAVPATVLMALALPGRPRPGQGHLRHSRDHHHDGCHLGNSATDPSGGHAEKTYKLPDCDGQLS